MPLWAKVLQLTNLIPEVLEDCLRSGLESQSIGDGMKSKIKQRQLNTEGDRC